MLLLESIQSHSSICVLLIDDDPAFRHLVGLLLQRRGFRVLSAQSGAEAVVLALRAEVALVDMIMPDMDGLETIALLHRENPQLEIVACSGSDEAFFRTDLDLLGVGRFLAKPFSVEMLEAELEAACSCAAA